MITPKDLIVVDRFLRFKKNKLDNKKEFKKRYTPVISFWVYRMVKELGYVFTGCEAQLFYQDGDNVIRNLVTLRVRIKCYEDYRTLTTKKH